MEQIKGKYRLERPLGRGGMAEVFLGRTLGAAGFSHRVAIKRILAEVSTDAQFQAMFIDEARLSARLAHSNVVSVLDFDEDEDGRLYLVMEYVDGIDLDGLLRTGPLPLPVVLFVIKEVLRGLGHAHDLPVGDDDVRGLVHRDVSPQNVLIAWDGAVKVSDFGIAKARAATHASASILLKGKAAYMSPEQANGAVLDGRSDLFAVGVILWEMLCGASLFDRESLHASLKAVLFDPIPSPRSRRADVPEDIERVTMQLLERNREDRYRDADAAIAAITACAAFPKDGRDLLSSLLIERLPDRARCRGAGDVTRLERPASARGSAGADPEETAVAPPAPPRADLPDPFGVVPSLRPRARRIAPLALLGVATALAAGVAVGTAAHLNSREAVAAPPGAAPPPVVSPVDHRPSNEERASATPMSDAAGPPVRAPSEDAAARTSVSAARTTPAASARDAPGSAAAQHDSSRSARDRAARAALRTGSFKAAARPEPTRGATKPDGIRVIDLGSSPSE
jgi:serine/threonine protein kinase